eukprot:g32657.t1
MPGFTKCVAEYKCCGVLYGEQGRPRLAQCAETLGMDEFDLNTCLDYEPYGTWGSSGGGAACRLGEMYCRSNVYDSNGEWNEAATMAAKEFCVPEYEGCPCNSEFEEMCDSQGFKFCESKKLGCPSLFNVECDETAYDATTGEPDWNQQGNEFCAPAATGCPCDAT